LWLAGDKMFEKLFVGNGFAKSVRVAAAISGPGEVILSENANDQSLHNMASSNQRDSASKIKPTLAASEYVDSRVVVISIFISRERKAK
jgi:hypothetical protein